MKKRWNNIFQPDGKTFILAIDHGTVLDVSSLIPDTGKVIRTALENGVDTILTTFGVAEEYTESIGGAGLILRLDTGTTVMHPSGKVFDKMVNTFSVEDAVKLGADGVVCLGNTHIQEEVDYLKNISMFYSDCRKWGMVFCAEMIPGGFLDPSKVTVKNVAFACRIGAEYGADFIKAPYVGDSTSFKEKIIDTCFKPVVILGGGNPKTDVELLRIVKDSIDAGGKGVAFGRCIWGNKNLPGICRAVSMIIHDGVSVQEAAKELK